MEDIILIPSYTPTKEKENLLRDLIHSLKIKGYKVAVCTHSITPNDIIQKCDYFFFDKENQLIYDPSIQYWNIWKDKIGENNYEFRFKAYNVMATHIIPIVKMVYPSLQYLKNLGYKKAHLLEYDNKILDCDIIDQHSILLNEFDIVSYYDDDFYYSSKSNINEYFFGCFKSYNLEKIDLNLLSSITPNELISEYKEYWDNKKFPVTEKIIYDKLSPSKKISWVPLSYLSNYIKWDQSEKVSSYGEDQKFFVHNHNNKFHFFVHNLTGKRKLSFDIIINGKNFPIEVSPGFWVWKPLCEYDENSVIKIFKNNKFVIEIDMKNPKEKEWITKWAKVVIF